MISLPSLHTLDRAQAARIWLAFSLIIGSMSRYRPVFLCSYQLRNLIAQQMCSYCPAA